MKNTSDKKYCSVCHKAGKPEKDYTNHYIKSTPGPNGIVVCPTILSNHCKKCNGYGHFSDHCKAKARVFDTRSREAIPEKKPEKKPEKTYEELWPAIGEVAKPKRVQDGNGFAALDEETMPKAKPVAHKMNFKKMLETDYVEPKKDDGFIGNFKVLTCKSFKVMQASNIPTPTVVKDSEWEEYNEDDWEQEEYEAELDRRMQERYEALEYEDEHKTWEDAW